MLVVGIGHSKPLKLRYDDYLAIYSFILLSYVVRGDFFSFVSSGRFMQPIHLIGTIVSTTYFLSNDSSGMRG